MKSFDADVLTLLFKGDSACLQKMAVIPLADQAVPIVVVEQILRGRMHVIRQAQAPKSRISVDYAYSLLESSLSDLRQFRGLALDAQAEALVQASRKQKIRVGISDLRIAAICVTHSATLVSRNRRDFDLVPGLIVEYW